MQVTVSAESTAPPEAVFDVLADLGRWPEILPNVDRLEVGTAGPVGVGTRFRLTRTVFKKPATEELVVAEFLPPTLLAVTAAARGANYRLDYRLGPVGAGSRVEVLFGGRPLGLLADVLAPLAGLVAPEIRKALAGDLQAVVREAERRAGSPPSEFARQGLALASEETGMFGGLKSAVAAVFARWGARPPGA